MARRLLFIGLLLLFTAAPAAADPHSRKHRVDAQIETLNSKIASARAKEQQLAAQIAGVSARIRELEAEVGDVSRDLATLERDLALQQEKLARITELWKLQTEKLQFLKQQHEQAVGRLNARLVAIYQSGNVTTLDVVVAAESFGDLVSRLEYARELAAQDKRIADSVGEAKIEMKEAQARTTVTRRQVAAVARAVAVRTEQMRVARDQLVARENALEATRGERKAALVSVQEQKEAYLHEVRALAAVSAQLGAQIRSAQAPSSGAASLPPVQPSGGGLMWPVSGPVTSPFGWRWGRMHEGIDIAAPTGTPMRAAASGRVIYSGWMSGYGNLVVIDHGGGLATAYAHASAIYVGNGTSVAQGQAIAAVGCTGHCFGSHLHFEVRVNGSPVDPLGYLG